MKIEKVNGFWVPSNDVHIEDWKKDKHFTQNKCLEKLIAYCKDKKIKFKPGFNLLSNLTSFQQASHEWLGLLSYYFLNRTDRIF